MCWRRRTLPPDLPGSTIRAAGLNGRVRDGNECIPCAKATSNNQVQVERRSKPHEVTHDVSKGVGSFEKMNLGELVKPHGLLVRLGYMCRHTSTYRLSTC